MLARATFYSGGLFPEMEPPNAAGAATNRIVGKRPAGQLDPPAVNHKATTGDADIAQRRSGKMPVTFERPRHNSGVDAGAGGDARGKTRIVDVCMKTLFLVFIRLIRSTSFFDLRIDAEKSGRLTASG